MTWYDEEGSLEDLIKNEIPMPHYVPAAYVKELLEAYRKLKEVVDDWEMKWEAMHDY